MGMMIIRHKVRDYGQWRSSGKFQEGKLQAFDELGHKSKVERINCIAGKVIVWICKKAVSVTITAGKPASQNEA